MELLDFFRERNYLSEVTYGHVVEYIGQWKCSSYDALLDTNLFTQSDIADYLAAGLKITRIEKLSTMEISQSALAQLPYSIAYELTCVPIKTSADKSSMEVVFLNPLNSDDINKVSRFTKLKIEPLVAERYEILKTMRRHYPTTDQLSIYDES